MYRVVLLCRDAWLRKKLERCLREHDLHLVSSPPVDAVVAVEPVLSEAQSESLQAYIDCGSIEEAAERRGCSPHTLKNHLRQARQRLGVKNCVQLVCLAQALGLVDAVYSSKVSEKWHESAIDTGGGRSRIGVENHV